MPEASQVEYKLRELTELMVRDRQINEGHWMLVVRFSFGALNVEDGVGGVAPASISRIESIGIQRIPEANAISVDASQLQSRARKRK